MTSLLVADPFVHTLYQRRRAECASLARCEWAWVEVHGGDQAACPPGCGGYQRVGEVPEVVAPAPPIAPERAPRAPARLNGAEVVALRRGGATVAQLAERFGVSKVWIHRVSRANGYRARKEQP